MPKREGVRERRDSWVIRPTLRHQYPQHTSTPDTMETSSTVGNTLNTRALRMKLIPLKEQGSMVQFNEQCISRTKDWVPSLSVIRRFHCTFSAGLRLYVPCAPVDGPGHGPSLAREVVVEVEGVEVHEGGLGQLTDRLLGHLGKHRIAKLVEEGRSESGRSICGDIITAHFKST